MAGLLKRDLETALASAVFRANPNYELVLFDRLPPSQQAMLADLKARPNFYGILRPQDGSGLSVKSVTRDTALLYLTMRDAGTLPHYAVPADGEHASAIVKLVLDQILQVQQSDRFVSGAEAYETFYETAAASSPQSRIQQLSVAALKYGQALKVDDVLELSARLYSFHHVPTSMRWLETFPTTDRIKERLGISKDGPYRAFLDASWDAVRPDSESAEGEDGWLSWVLRRPFPSNTPRESMHKLYISPRPEYLENVFPLTLRTLTKTAALQFKVGANVDGLLRPDKMVAYFGSFADLESAAAMLGTALEGCPAQGVPFTAELTGDGLLSWGVDPPVSERLLNWQPKESWRLWLTNRLANALLTARNTGASTARMEPWEYALQRIELEGIDTQSWTAARTSWA